MLTNTCDEREVVVRDMSIREADSRSAISAAYIPLRALIHYVNVRHVSKLSHPLLEARQTSARYT